MKKTLLTLFAAITVFAASAQIGQGTILLGGSSSLDFTSFNEDAGDYSQFDVGVKGGYFIIDNLALGLNLSLSKNSELDDALLGVGPFARYYFNGKIFGGAGINIVKFGEFSATEIPLEVGYAIFLNDAVAIEPKVNYSVFGGDASGGAFGLNVGISVYLGRN